jgi:PAS domain S-box-containing protein
MDEGWGDFTPHGFCLAWDPGLIWLQAGSDLAIAMAYYSIPAALLVFLRRRRDLAFRPVFGLFAAFILACGTTHLLGVLTLWQPVYWIDGGVKAVTAALSVATAFMLWPLLPKALALPSPAALRHVNDQLAQQVAERDAAMKLLRAREEQLFQLYAHSPAVLHALDADGTVLEVSDRWLALFGYAREEVIGRPVTSFYAPETRAGVAAELAALRAGQGSLRGERHVISASGEIRIAEMVMALERDTTGAVSRFLVALTDVTARRQAEEALHASEERLRQAQKMEAVGQLTGGLAHDFNNLLTTIMGSLELLEKRGGLDERGHRLTGNALEGARRAARLTSQLLTFSRRARLEPVSLDLPAVLNGFQTTLARSVGAGVPLLVSPPAPGLWPVMADRGQLEVALLNLVMNARDAVLALAASGERTDGKITIDFENETLAMADPARRFTDPLSPGDYVCITVADNGGGMPPEVLAHAFEPFFTTKKAGAGTGLGLAQTYGFATQSGGAVQIASVVGAGTKVKILLPRAQAMEADGGAALQRQTTSPPADKPSPTGHGETILLVEDDALLRHTVAGALEDEGYVVIATPHGAAALAVIESGRHLDLLFTDVMMPGGLNGVQVAQAARLARPTLKVMFATGYSDRKILAAWQEPLDLLAKPYALKDLAARIALRIGLPASQEVPAA